MPVKITKTSATNSKPKPKSGSLLSKVVDVSSVERNPFRILLYGPNRAGKTYLACTFEKPLLLVSFEPGGSGGAESVRDFKGVDYLHMNDTDQAIELAREIRESHYKTLVIDSATSLQDLVLRDLLGLEDVPVQMAWGTASTDQYRQRAEKTKGILNEFLRAELDIIITAKEKDHNPPKRNEDGKVDMRPRIIKPLQMESFVAADLGGSTVGWLHDCCDYIFRLYKDEERKEKKTVVGKKTITTVSATGKFVRHLLVDYHPTYAGGCRLGAGRVNLPEGGIITEPTYEKIIELIQGKGGSK